jgi:hypothetical protein
MSSLPQPLGQPWVILLIYYRFGHFGRRLFRSLVMKKMQISHSLKLGLLLSIPMFLAGIGSGIVAYQLGYASLKGVSQPDINPSKKFTNDRTSYARNQEFTPVPEEEVIKKVKVYIQQQTKNKDKATQKQKKDEKQSFLLDKQDKLRGFRWG